MAFHIINYCQKQMSAGARGDRILTPLRRVDEQIAKLADVSRDTVRKVEEILQYLQEEGGEIIIQKLRMGEMSINEAYELMFKEEEEIKQQQKEQEYTISLPVTPNNNIITDTATAFKASPSRLAVKEE